MSYIYGNIVPVEKTKQKLASLGEQHRMKKINVLILAGAMALTMGTQAFAAGKNNGNHYGWEKGRHNPHKTVITSPKSVEQTASSVNSYANLPYGVTDEAIALDKHRVDLMADEATIQGIEADFNSGSNPAYLDIIGIKVLNGQLAYVISNDINPNNLPVVSGMAHNLVVNELGYKQLHFMLPQEDEVSSLFYVEGANVFLTK